MCKQNCWHELRQHAKAGCTVGKNMHISFGRFTDFSVIFPTTIFASLNVVCSAGN